MAILRTTLILAILALPSPAATLFVSKSGDGSSGDSWVSAFQTVCNAVGAATSGDEIWVASGTYTENIGIDFPLRIFGGFAGNETEDQVHLSDPTKNVTTLISGGQASVFVIRSSSTIDGLGVTNGGRLGGSGIIIRDATVTISRCNIFANGKNIVGQSSSGGGVNAFRTCLFIKDCAFIDNAASSRGGGLAILECEAHISRTRFIRNDGGQIGGALISTFSTYDIDGCLFEKNTNVLPPPPHFFTNQGGAIYSQESSGRITNSIFNKNNSSSSEIRLRDSSDDGVLLLNNTFDVVGPLGGDIAITWEGVGPVVKNCVFIGGDNAFFQNLNALVTYSNIQGGYPGEGNIDADPLFVDPANGDYRLMPGSPCIEAGTDTGLSEDFDGKRRPLGDYDMGAFEYPFLRGDIDLDGRVDDNDLMILSRDWKKVSGS